MDQHRASGRRGGPRRRPQSETMPASRPAFYNNLEDMPGGYPAMNERRAIKSLIEV